MKLSNIDWYCDECNEYLNNQPGFNSNCGSWSCTNCGEVNYIDENEILNEDEYDSFKDSGFDSYNDYTEYMNSDEALSKEDAALIWASHGKDEDYLFGYSEEELEDEL